MILRFDLRNGTHWLTSAALHALVVAPFLLAIFVFPNLRVNRENVPITISEIEKPVEATEQPKSVRLTEPKPIVAPKEVAQPVFGLSKDTLVDETGTSEIKAGNTIAKEVDNIVAKNTDALPVPTDEYLVTSMPKLKKEVRATYPEAARVARIDGPVVMDILVDSNGFVVDVQIVSGLGYGLDEAAIQAIKKFEFEPARVQDQRVAVRIRYTYRFELRSS